MHLQSDGHDTPQHENNIVSICSFNSCGAYLYEVNGSEKLLNESTTVFIFSCLKNGEDFIGLTGSNLDLYIFPLIQEYTTIKLAKYMYIICHGKRYIGIAFPTFLFLIFNFYLIFFLFHFFFCCCCIYYSLFTDLFFY